MLPIELGLQAREALADQVLTVHEATQMSTTVFNSVVGAMAFAFGMMMLGVAVGNPGSGNPGSMTSDIIERAGLKEFEYRWFPEPEEPRPPKVHEYTRTRSVGSYDVVMVRDDTCKIRLFENLPGGKRKLRATWSGLGWAECERKFLEVVDVVTQVRFEQKTSLMR